MNLLSIIVPCYNEQESAEIFYKETIKTLKIIENQFDYEIIYVDDGSKDNTLSVVKSLNQQDKNVKYISFSRNFGKEAGIYAGLKNAKGNYICIMDVDLQDPPELIPEMLDSIINEDFDCVATRRTGRKGEPPIRSFFARSFYKLINNISKTEVVDGARDFRIMTRQMVDAILQITEYNRFSKGIFGWVGFNTKWISYENVKRVAGETKWSFWKLLIYSLDGIVGFSTAPLAISSIFGFILCLIAIIGIFIVIIKTIIFGDPVAGYPSLICTILLIGGIQLLCIGILGQYLSKTYLETKKRPIYIIKEDCVDEK